MNTGIKEVARLAGVAPSTVSRVLSGNIPVSPVTKQKVLDAVAELNYQPNPVAQGLKGGSLKTIGLFLPNVRSLVFPAAIRGIEDVAQKNGYTLVLCNTDENPDKEKMYVDNLRRRLVDGFIVSTVTNDNSQYWSELNNQLPVVHLIRHSSEESNSVVLDNFDAAYQATKYLVDAGHRKIAIINGCMNALLYRERFQGYCQALQDSGLTVQEELIVHEVNGMDDSYQVMMGLLKQGLQPEAIFASSDPKAVGVMRAVKDAGLQVPQDISVIGIDNSDISAYLEPPLTTIAQPFYDMGVRACEKLIRIIEKKRRIGPKTEVFPAQMVVRSSVRGVHDCRK